jgi:hypothetical protein
MKLPYDKTGIKEEATHKRSIAGVQGEPKETGNERLLWSAAIGVHNSNKLNCGVAN